MLFAMRMGRDFGMDADIIMSWPLSKIYRYMAFYLTETDDFKKNLNKDKVMSFEEIVRLMEKDGLLNG